ncbi:OmpH family outer membrane protein [Elizabethkingia miricola]|uniref:OmpH family outer membrane protein n=1 Tax=Elizabethkingia miricola TaxID=172045 RepID=UPI000B351236|nr:OmpH family outer membrane protein [Elizabethkingia miricola]NHQ65360.1 OmpH family outer membrane protein [Elizabethkingia miricola]NHQ69438.1 OmpH family outer membrane protein [Elizabethkingia miricola]NHQ77268.1 OmpH family outer membrane protein [Elizabethkingia miricola]PSL87498.1 OmpH family outer membrane protein [Elizabethkingia miricola]QHQ87225.1 OmpH family outer membrane protein [Elizabethkingia miricola]
MKRLSVLFAAVLMMVSFTVIKAQKLAHADIAGILTAMPEMKKANEQLEALGKMKQAELVKLQQALQDKAQAYQKAGKQDQAKEAEFQKEADNIQKMGQAAQKDVADKQETLYAPIDKKLNDAISAVAKAKGLEYVFDANGQGLVYKGGLDVTADIKKQLGIQ